MKNEKMGKNVHQVVFFLVRACRQEELHGGGVTVERGIKESRAVILCMRGKRMEEGVSERQKRGTRVPARREHGLGCVGTAGQVFAHVAMKAHV